MPFDSAPEPSTPEIALIDTTLELLGPHGEHWVQNKLHSNHGEHCLIGALSLASKRLQVSPDTTDTTVRFVLEAITHDRVDAFVALHSIGRYNDHPFRHFHEIKNALLQARQRAVAAATVKALKA